MNAAEQAINDYLDDIDRQLNRAELDAALVEYEAMRQAHRRGDITDAQLRAFLVAYDRAVIKGLTR